MAVRGENADELWDLYTKDREKTGSLHRRADRMKKGQYRLAVHVCIFNSRNELLIQQRQPFKKAWPNMWDVSIGGSAAAGETSSQAAQREVQEELGLALPLSDARPMFTMNFETGFDDFYIVELDVELSSLRLQEEEVKAVRWADRAEVIRLQEQGLMIPYWFLERLFTIRTSYSAQGERLSDIKAVLAHPAHLESWMSLVEIMQEECMQLHSQEAVRLYRAAAASYIEKKRAVCVLDGQMVIGILLAGAPEDMPCRAAVHPEYRGQGILERMQQLADGLA